MIHIYHGSGKGKTTTALGLAIRMAGHHKKMSDRAIFERWHKWGNHLLKKSIPYRCTISLSI